MTDTIPLRRPMPHLTYGDVQVAKVFAVNRTKDTADVYLMTCYLTGSWARIAMGCVSGYWRGVGYASTTLTPEEVREELERRSPLVYGTSKVAKVVEEECDVLVFEVGHADMKDAA